MKTIIPFIFLAFCTFSCKKDTQQYISPTLALLQNTWTPTSTRVFFPNGQQFKLIPFTTVTFYSNGTVISMFDDHSSQIDYTTEGYNLLSDDSTLIYSQLVNGKYIVEEGDTSVVKTLTNHLLVINHLIVIYHKNNSFIYIIDSLKR
jgi:hypothetical protein